MPGSPTLSAAHRCCARLVIPPVGRANCGTQYPVWRGESACFCVRSHFGNWVYISADLYSGFRAHHDPLFLHLDDIALQRPRWWTRDVLAVEIKVPVVAGAPDVSEVRPVLHDASE